MRTLKGFLYLILGGTLCGWMFNRIAAWFIDNSPSAPTTPSPSGP